MSFAWRPDSITNRARPDTFTAPCLLWFSGGAVVGRHASLKALFRSPSFIDSSPVLLLLLLFHLYWSLLKIPKKLWLQMEKISASYRYAFQFRSSLSKRFDFFSPTLLHLMTSFALLLSFSFLRCLLVRLLPTFYTSRSLRCALLKVHCWKRKPTGCDVA